MIHPFFEILMPIPNFRTFDIKWIYLPRYLTQKKNVWWDEICPFLIHLSTLKCTLRTPHKMKKLVVVIHCISQYIHFSGNPRSEKHFWKDFHSIMSYIVLYLLIAISHYWFLHFERFKIPWAANILSFIYVSTVGKTPLKGWDGYRDNTFRSICQNFRHNLVGYVTQTNRTIVTHIFLGSLRVM